PPISFFRDCRSERGKEAIGRNAPLPNSDFGLLEILSKLSPTRQDQNCDRDTRFGQCVTALALRRRMELCARRCRLNRESEISLDLISAALLSVDDRLLCRSARFKSAEGRTRCA